MRKDKTFNAKRNQSGFTILELMVAVTIAAILVVVAVPSFEESVRRNRIDGEAQKIFGLLKQARTSALMSNTPGFVCRSNPDDSVEGTASCDDTGNDWGVELKVYVALPTTEVPEPDGSYGNQALDELENDGDNRQRMLRNSTKAPSDNLVVTASVDDVVLRFNSDGTVSNAAPFRIAVCDSDADNPDRYGQLIELNQSGQIRLSRVSDGDRGCMPNS